MGISQYPPTSTSGGGSGGLVPPKSIKNGYSTSGYTPPTVTLSQVNNATLQTVTSGAASAGVLNTMLNLSGAGLVDVLCGYFVAVTSATLRIKVTIDGTVAFDSTSGTITNAGRGGIVAGQLVSGTNITPEPFKYNSSCLIEMASSANYSSGDLAIGISYRTE